MHSSNASLGNHVEKFIEAQRASRLLLAKKKEEANRIIERADRPHIDDQDFREMEAGQVSGGYNFLR